MPLLLDLKPGEWVVRGVEDPSLLTDACWPRGVSQACGIDVLAAVQAPRASRGSLWDYSRLFSFVRERYDMVIVDLGDALDEVAAAAVGMADRLWVVAAPESPSLALIARRVRAFERDGHRVDHLEVILNRYVAEEGSVADLAAAVGRPLGAVLPEDSKAVKEALRHCRLVGSKSVIGREISKLALKFLQSVDPGFQPPAPPSLRKLVTNALGF